jgi:hypothetical protein
MDPTSIAAATWGYVTRTLATGTPAAPTDRAGRIAQAVWQYATRTLGGSPPPAPVRLVFVLPVCLRKEF